MKKRWLVAVCRASPTFLAKPSEFLSRPSSRSQPSWICGVVSASTRDNAFDVGMTEWGLGKLDGQKPGDELINWYVAPLE